MAGNSDGRKGLLHPNVSSIERASQQHWTEHRAIRQRRDFAATHSQ
jgi:hypothetical protein